MQKYEAWTKKENPMNDNSPATVGFVYFFSKEISDHCSPLMKENRRICGGKFLGKLNKQNYILTYFPIQLKMRSWVEWYLKCCLSLKRKFTFFPILWAKSLLVQTQTTSARIIVGLYLFETANNTFASVGLLRRSLRRQHFRPTEMCKLKRKGKTIAVLTVLICFCMKCARNSALKSTSAAETQDDVSIVQAYNYKLYHLNYPCHSTKVQLSSNWTQSIENRESFCLSVRGSWTLCGWGGAVKNELLSPQLCSNYHELDCISIQGCCCCCTAVICITPLDPCFTFLSKVIHWFINPDYFSTQTHAYDLYLEFWVITCQLHTVILSLLYTAKFLPKTNPLVKNLKIEIWL